LLTIIQHPGGIADQIAPITRWLRGERFTLHPDGKSGGKKHSSPLAKFRRKGDAASSSNGSSPETETEKVTEDSGAKASEAESISASSRSEGS
jgi:hypothetical protein